MPPQEQKTVGVLGTSISAFTYGSQKDGWPALAEAHLRRHGPPPDGWKFTNYSQNGLKASDYLTGGAVPPATWKGNHDYYVVELVANEGLVAPMTADTASLIAEIEDGGGVAILMTLYPVDQVGGHWRADLGDKDAAIEALNEVYRTAASGSSTVHLIDLWQDITDLGIWDIRIRNYTMVGGAVTDSQYWGPNSSFDGDGLGGSDDPLWYTEIHPHRIGHQRISDSVVTFLEENLVATTTLDAFRLEMIEKIEAITPTTKLHDREVAYAIAPDSVTFEEWALANEGNVTRQFTIYDTFEDVGIEISDRANLLREKRIEIYVAYQTDHKYGDFRQRDLQKVIREDYDQISNAVGLNAAYTVGCTIPDLDEPFRVDSFPGVLIMTIPYRARFHEATP